MCKFIRRLTCSSLFCLTALLTGCFSPVVSTPVSHFTLSDNFQAKRTAHKQHSLRKSVLVLMPVAAPAYTSEKMIYQNVPYKLSSYANSEWAAPPSHLLLPILAGAVRATGDFYAVMTPPFSGHADYLLVTKLLTFQQEFFKPVSQERVVIDASIIKMSTNRVVASRVFKSIVNAPSNDPYGGVLAANIAVNKLARRISTFVGKVTA